MATIVVLVILIVSMLLGAVYFTYHDHKTVKQTPPPMYPMSATVLNTLNNESKLTLDTTNILITELHVNYYQGTNHSLPYYKISFNNKTVFDTLQNTISNWGNIADSMYIGYLIGEINISINNGSMYNYTLYSTHFLSKLVHNSMAIAEQNYADLTNGRYQINTTLAYILQNDYGKLAGILQYLTYIMQYNQTYIEGW